jgi:hypothetical protein
MTAEQIDVLLKIIGDIPFGNLLAYIVLGCLCGSIIIRVATGNKKNIFTLAIGYFGDLLFEGVSEKVEGMHDKLNSKLDKVQAQAELNAEEMAKFKNDVEKREAKRLRADILCFADACRGGTRYTRKHYENVLNEISDYKALCEEAHVENHVLKAEEEFINNLYKALLAENKFL